MVFMSCTSSTSAELIAISSVLTYDVYRSYINPKATGKQLVLVSHCTVVGFGIAMGALSTLFNYIGVTIGWMLTFVGIVLCPSVPVLACTIFWGGLSKPAMIISPLLGMCTGLACWLGATANLSDGVINQGTLTSPYPTLIGNCVSLFSPIPYMIILSFFKKKSLTLIGSIQRFVSVMTLQLSKFRWRMKLSERMNNVHSVVHSNSL